jgi:hypothetical protein
VVLTAYLIHRGSHESKDTDERVQKQLNRLERKLDRLTTRRPRGRYDRPEHPLPS